MLSNAFLQRAAEDARGAAAARQVPARDDRSAEAAGHRAVALSAVQSQAVHGRADSGAAREDLRGREASRSTPTGLKAHRARRRRQHARRAELARPEHRIRRRQGRRPRRVAAMLGSIDRGHVLRLLAALAKQDGAALLAEVEKLDESAPDYGAVLDELLEALQRIAVLQLVGGRSDDEEFAAVAPFVEQFAAEDVQLYYQIALHGRRDLPYLPRAAHGFRDDAAADARVSARASDDGARRRRQRDRGAAPSAQRPRLRATAGAAASGAPRLRRKLRCRSATIVRDGRARGASAAPNGQAGRQCASAGSTGRASCRRSTCAGPRASSPIAAILQSNAGGCVAARRAGRQGASEHPAAAHAPRSRAARAASGAISGWRSRSVSRRAPTPAEVRRANESARMREAREAIETRSERQGVQARSMRRSSRQHPLEQMRQGARRQNREVTDEGLEPIDAASAGNAGQHAKGAGRARGHRGRRRRGRRHGEGRRDLQARGAARHDRGRAARATTRRCSRTSSPPRSTTPTAKVEQTVQQKMSSVTGGLGLPAGLKLPF